MNNETRSARDIVLNAKPINLYGYTIIISACIVVLSFVYPSLIEDSRPGVPQVVAITMLVPVFSYLFRFYWSRNNLELRKIIESADSDEQAFSLIMGGYTHGLSMLLLMGLVFYLSLMAFVL